MHPNIQVKTVSNILRHSTTETAKQRVHINTNHGFQNFTFVGVKLCTVHLPTAHMIPGDHCSEALPKVQRPVLRKPLNLVTVLSAADLNS